MTTSPRRDRRSFTDEFKADAVAMVLQLGRTRADVARDLEINESTLGWILRWLRATVPVPTEPLFRYPVSHRAAAN